MSDRYLTSTKFLRGKIFSLVESLLRINKKEVDNHHPGYNFIQPTPAINFREASSVGIYTNKKKEKLIIKDYAYTLKNLDYEYLHNEINTLNLLNYKRSDQSHVRVPELIHSGDSNHRITLITKYVKGETFDHLDAKTRERVLIDVIAYLQKQTQVIPAEMLNNIPKRLPMLSYISFPFYFVRCLLQEPSKIKLFLKALRYFIAYAPSCLFQKVPYGLCHRDLSSDNILYDKRKKRITILDTECMVLTDRLFDIALLPRLFIKYLTHKQFDYIFKSLQLQKKEKKRLIILMIAGCINKIATERKNTRDYINAVLGLLLVVEKLIPDIIQQL